MFILRIFASSSTRIDLHGPNLIDDKFDFPSKGILIVFGCARIIQKKPEQQANEMTFMDFCRFNSRREWFLVCLILFQVSG